MGEIFGQLGLDVIDDLEVLSVGEHVLETVELGKDYFHGFGLAFFDQIEVVAIVLLFVDDCLLGPYGAENGSG